MLGIDWLERLGQDLRYGIRMLAGSPGLTAVAIVTLAIGIGSSAAVFSQVNAVFWKPLPVEKPQELRTLVWTSPRHPFAGNTGLAGPRLPNVGETMGSISWPAYMTIRDQGKSFSNLACWLDAGENRPVVFGEYGLGRVQFVSGNYFETLGVKVILGRTINPDDDKKGSPSPVAVLSYPFWQRTFGGDPSVIRRTMTLNGRTFAIVGVLPQGFFGFDPGQMPDVMVPLTMIPVASMAADPLPATTLWSPCRLIARLRPGVTDEQARLESENIVADAIRSNPPREPYDPPKFYILDGSHGTDNLRTATSGPLLILMAVVIGILLIACANIAGLQLARGSSRQREIATRLAVGAPRLRLVRQLVTESLLLSALGGIAGLLLAYGLSRLMPGLLGQFAPLGGTSLNADYLHSTMFGAHGSVGVEALPDVRVLGFSIALSVITGLIFGTVPALRSTRVDLLSSMKVSSSGSSRGSFRFASGKAMVAFQAALSMILLIGAGLFIRTVINLHAASLGYQPGGLLYVRIEPRTAGIPLNVPRADFFENVLKHLEGGLGISSVTASFSPPLGSLGDDSVLCNSSFTPGAVGDRSVVRNVVAPRFFETMRQRVLFGREFDWHDRQGSDPVVLINETLAKKFYAGENPIGQKLRINCQYDPAQYTIVGVVEDSKWVPRSDAGPIVYQSFQQTGTGDPMTLIIRVANQPLKMVPSVRKAVTAINPKMPTFGEVTPTDLLDQHTSRESMLTNLVVFFGAIALLLSCLGIYGLLAYTVSRRTWEIGLRMALGARRNDVIRLVLEESLIPVAAGLVGGTIAALALSRLVDSILYGVSNNDPLSIGIAVLLFLIISAAAAMLPAYRASTIDPKTALR
jgi:predicted permease